MHSPAYGQAFPPETDSPAIGTAHSERLARPRLIRPLHVVLGNSGTGCVRAACESFGMPGSVFGFSDDLTHGPLSDQDARLTYLRGFAAWPGEEVTESREFFSEWKAFHECLRALHPDAVIVWHSANLADAIFVALACHQLDPWPGRLMHARLPGVDARPFVAMHSPPQIAQFFAAHQAISIRDSRAFVQNFERIRDTCGPLRWLQHGQVIGVAMDHVDPLLLAACSPDWLAAMRVVGEAMRHGDGPNLLSDRFFIGRLGSLIKQGRVEVNGPPGRLRQCAVKLAHIGI